MQTISSIPNLPLFVVLILMPLLAVGCARSPVAEGEAGLAQPLTLTLEMSALHYAPGQAVVVTARLANPQAAPQVFPSLNHVSLKFSVRPNHKAGAAAPSAGRRGPPPMVEIEPVYSELEKTGQPATLAPGAPLARSFVFTTLAMERGDFILQAVYEIPDEAHPDRTRRIYARPVPFTIQGSKIAAHRYLNGLLIREDAIARALARDDGATTAAASAVVAVLAGDRPTTAASPAAASSPGARQTDAILVRDDRGFLNWWVNIQPPGAPAPVRAWLVDPYFGKVWSQARPFSPDQFRSRVQVPEKSRIFNPLRDRWKGK
ncbi:MAG: hypothetical protein M1457_11680 [bacterium]|nr:hypothetical protein [bacterium]